MSIQITCQEKVLQRCIRWKKDSDCIEGCSEYQEYSITDNINEDYARNYKNHS